MADIKLIRIDYRLIHGQVVTQWAKVTGINRIVLINDELAVDAFMGDIYRMSAPSGVSVDIWSVEKACEKWKQNGFGDGKILVLFKSAADALRAHESGFVFSDIQVGGLGGGAASSTACGIAFTREDVDELKLLSDRGVFVHVHVVPTAADTPLPQVIEKLSF